MSLLKSPLQRREIVESKRVESKKYRGCWFKGVGLGGCLGEGKREGGEGGGRGSEGRKRGGQEERYGGD